MISPLSRTCIIRLSPESEPVGKFYQEYIVRLLLGIKVIKVILK